MNNEKVNDNLCNNDVIHWDGVCGSYDMGRGNGTWV